MGLGTIGKKVARRAPAFDMRVQYYDIVRLSEDQEDALGVRKARGWWRPTAPCAIRSAPS